MKKQSNMLFTKINRESFVNLTMEVKETLAAGFNNPCPKIFTAADLWNIQRRRKNMVQRRFSF